MSRTIKFRKSAALLTGVCFLLGVISAQAATLTAATTADESDGSLRQALIDANKNAVANIVTIDSPLAPARATVSIGGRVISFRGGERGVPGAMVFLTDLDGNIRTTQTNGLGYYQFMAVPTNETYTMDVVAKHYQFSSQAVTVVMEVMNLDFVAL